MLGLTEHFTLFFKVQTLEALNFIKVFKIYGKKQHLIKIQLNISYIKDIQ